MEWKGLFFGHLFVPGRGFSVETYINTGTGCGCAEKRKEH